jgi:hypothetical protein
VKIITHYIYPPIPNRNMDWSAVTENYDADCDQDGYFSHDPIGYGKTESEAVMDLLEKLKP